MSLSYHSLFLLNDDTVKAVGYNNYGQLGTGNTANQSTPVEALVSNAKQITGGYTHTTFLLNDGTVKSVGQNSFGQLGTGNTTNQPTPVETLISDVKQIAGGYTHTVFLLNDDTVKAVGQNNYGQLGNGNIVNQSTPVETLVSDVKRIACGYTHTMFLLNDGTVKAVGRNNYGQLGTGNTTDQSTPVTVNVNINDVKQIACGEAHTIFLLKNGTVKAVGRNNYGQLGNGNTTDQSTPVTINISNVKQIACGEVHTVFLLKDGTVKAVGRNNYGQIGNGNIVNQSIPIETLINDVKQIACGNTHTTFLLKDGTVKAVGRNNFGQLGTGNTINRSTPVETLVSDVKSLWDFLLEKVIVKTLILNDGKYKTYNNGWTVVTSDKPTHAQFISDGMDSLSPLLDRKIIGSTPTETNWSPIDELEGDFEIVTWVSEADSEQVILNVSGIVSPKLIYSVKIAELKNTVDKFFASIDSNGYNEDYTRFILTSDNVNWFTWENEEFTPINLDNSTIIEKGMTAEKISSLTAEDLKKWTAKNINIGVLLVDDISGKHSSKLISTGIEEIQYTGTSTVSDANLYILNTTATISVDFSGLTLIGQVSDEDMTKVQYRVRLNGQPYYPKDGEFTALAPPPLNIDITLRSDEIKIGEWNELEVDFQDSFGEMDTWKSGQFEGRYAGLMFKDSGGDDYSSDLGMVIKYLDFGQIISGQITPSYEVKVKNTYGFDVKNATISVSTNDFATGLAVQLAKDAQTFSNNAETLSLGDLKNEEEATFFIRMVSDIDTIPNGATTFNIIVVADRDLNNI